MQISQDKLEVGKKYWYRYTKFDTVYGPFKLKRTYANQSGDHAVFHDGNGGTLDILLEDDADFGLLLLYDAKPEPE